MSFGKMMRSRRKALGMTQAELSEISHVPQSTISAVESGKQEPTESTMRQIASGLNCSIGSLLGADNTQKNSPPIQGDELTEKLTDLITNLPVGDQQRVLDFVAGLIASRKE